MIVGMFLYSGGTKFNPNTIGYSFYENYLSDLGSIYAYDGIFNRTPRIIFTIGVIFGGLGLAVFYLQMPYIFNKNKQAHIICIIGAILGILSAIACISVALIPLDYNTFIHRICTAIYGGLLLPAQILFGIVILKEKNYPNFYGWLYVSFGTLLAIYIALWLIFGFDSFYWQEISKIVGQKLVIFLCIFNTIIQAFGANNQISKGFHDSSTVIPTNE